LGTEVRVPRIDGVMVMGPIGNKERNGAFLFEEKKGKK
jgi:hypothetical protein